MNSERKSEMKAFRALLLVLTLSACTCADGNMPFGRDGNMPFGKEGNTPVEKTGDMPFGKASLSTEIALQLLRSVLPLL